MANDTAKPDSTENQSVASAPSELAAQVAVTGDDRMPPVGGAYARYVLFVLVLVYAINFIDRQILAILAEDIKRDLKLSDADLGFLYGTAFAVFYALFGIPLGRLADNWVRVRLLSAGLFVWSGMTALSGMAGSFGQLSAARIGVGIGEASASPSAFSMLSDWFPRERRATALAIYSAGLYIGGGVSLLIGAVVVKAWNNAYPVAGPLGLVGWQAAFLAVGIPGMILSLWVSTLKEPVRGRAEGLPEPPPVTNIGSKLWQDISSVIPPLTLFHLAPFGAAVLGRNIAAAAGFVALATLLIAITGDVPQWVAICLGGYAVTSWAQSLKQRDPPTYALIWGTPTFVLALLDLVRRLFTQLLGGALCHPHLRGPDGR
jgi:MFS family permease